MNVNYRSVFRWLVLAFWIGAFGSVHGQINRITVDYDLPSPVADGVSVYSIGNGIIREADGSLTVAYVRNHPFGSQQSPNFIYLARSLDAGAHWTFTRTDNFSFAARADCFIRLPAGGYGLAMTDDNRAYVNRSYDEQTWLPLDGTSELGQVYPMASTTLTFGTALDVDASGKQHLAYTRTFDAGDKPFNIGYRSSTNGGTNWSAEIDVTGIPHDFASQGFGALYPTLTTGPDGKVFIAFSHWYVTNIVTATATNAVHYNIPEMVTFDGTRWLPPQAIGDGSIGWYSYPTLCTDAAGNLHIAHVQHPGQSAAGRVIYRKMPRGGTALTDPIFVSPATNNVANFSMGVFESDSVVVAWDDYETATSVYHGVYAAGSPDGFQRTIAVSTPGATARTPSVRRRLGAFNEPTRMDVAWVENDAVTDPNLQFDRLMYADLGPVLPRAIVLSLQRKPTGADLQFTGVNGRSYQVQSSADLSAWTPLGAAVNGTGSVTTIQVTVSAAAAYYRLADVTP
jgi:hypothetical protein